jgi:hypothetical protein
MVLRWGCLRVPDRREEFSQDPGYRDLWMLKAVLHPTLEENHVNSMGHRIHHTVADHQR